ncbi:hypothetical protein BDQ17DRAFT_1433260 [Cyathus striatus]|nr:hypothetical protein BDQ17DRAFT_1433260 [Cyathus striatus]
MPSKSPATQDQYHHYIPRFMLRQFQVDAGKKLTKKERQRAYRKAKKNPSLSSENVLFYDLDTGILDTRPIQKAYGEKNLYKDIRNTDNFNHVEEKLGRLENEAAKLIDKMKASISSGTDVHMTRKELGEFRKFLFLLHYRLDYKSKKEDNPDNAPVRDWYKKRKQDKGLKDDNDLFIDGMEYFLQYPHHVLVAEGEAIERRLGGPEEVSRMKRTRVDPDINYYALQYAFGANTRFMGIWEAADDAEFILGSNSFGMFEGSGFGGGYLHRIYTLSPRMVIALRDVHCPSDDALIAPFINSDLLNVPMRYPVIRYADFRKDEYRTTMECKSALEQYRTSEAAQKDMYTFKVTKLTKAQTQALNNAILACVHADDKGSVTFASKSCMLDTLRAFNRSDRWYYEEAGRRYSALLKPCLLYPPILASTLRVVL